MNKALPLNRFCLLLVTSVALVTGGCAALPDMRTAKLAANAGDYETARIHYEKLAAFGVPEAQVELAIMELKEQGASADSGRGVTLLESAEAEDNPRALFELGKAYQEGKVVQGNIPKAREYLKRALDQGYVRAYYQLAILSEDQKDYSEAESLYRRAYSAGYFKAASRIGALYKNGKGRPVDFVQALAWYYVAQDQAVPELERQIAGLEAKLGTEKIVEARDLSKGLR